MKKIAMFKMGDIIPEGATYLSSLLSENNKSICHRCGIIYPNQALRGKGYCCWGNGIPEMMSSLDEVIHYFLVDCPDTKECECPDIAMYHKPGECKGTYELKLYERDGKQLWLCSVCNLPGDELVEEPKENE